MFIRMADGRDRGQVLDVIEEEARALLATGQASSVDFGESDALGLREVPTRELESAEHHLSPEVSTFVDSLANGAGEVSLPDQTPASGARKPPAGHFKRRSR